MGDVMLKIRVFLVVAAIAGFAVACGGGGSSNMSSPSSTGMSAVMATGAISGFGSIFVNGTEFQTTNATIRKNGQTVDQSQLAVGEVARIKGQKNDADSQGTAQEVDVDEAVAGPISRRRSAFRGSWRGPFRTARFTGTRFNHESIRRCQ